MTYHAILDMVLESFLFALCISSICIIAFSLYCKISHQHSQRPFRLVLLIIYVSMLLYVTVLRGELFLNEEHSINLIPLDELISASYYQSIVLGKRSAVLILAYNVLGNIAWFIPLGMFLSCFIRQINAKKTMLYAMLFSGMIEVLQYVFYTGISDVDDVIFNVLGALCGYYIYNWMKAKRKCSDKNDN